MSRRENEVLTPLAELAEPMPCDPYQAFDLEATRLALRNTVDSREIDQTDIDAARIQFFALRRGILRETRLEQLRRTETEFRLIQPEEDERNPVSVTEEELDSFIEGGEHLLTAEVFDTMLVPAVRRVSLNAAQFSRNMGLALECLPALNSLNLSRATHTFTPVETLGQFFEAAGPFHTLLSNWGESAVRAGAAFQGGGEYESDKEHSGPWPIDKLKSLIEGTLGVLDPSLHTAFFEALAARSNQTRRKGIRFVQKTPQIQQLFEVAGQAQLFPVWLAVAGTGSDSYENELYAESVVEEMQKIMQCEESQPGALRFFLFCLKEVFPGGGSGGVSFSKDSTMNYLPGVIDKLREAGHSPEEITELMDRCCSDDRFPARLRYYALQSRPTLSSAFPGGIDALEAYFEKIAACPRGARSLVYIFEEEKAPQANMDVYLEQGVAVVEAMGIYGHCYFEHYRDHLKLLESDPALFKARVKRSIELSNRTSHVHTLYKYHPRSSLLQVCLSRFSDTDEQFEAFLAGAEKMINLFEETSIEKGDRYSEMIASYLWPRSVLFDSNHRPKKETFEAEFDWSYHVDQVIAYSSDEEEARGPYRWTRLSRNHAPWISGERVAETIRELPPYSKERTEGLMARVAEAKDLQKDIYQTRNGLVCSEDMRALHAQWLTRCDALSDGLDSIPYSDLLNLESFQTLRSLIEETWRVLQFRRFAYGILQPDQHVKASDFLKQAHPGTQLAVMGGTLAHALGTMKEIGINTDLGPLALPQARSISDGTFEGNADDILDSELGRELRRRIALLMPRIEGQVLAERFATAGFSFVGGKTHASEAIPVDRLNAVNALFGLEANTPFSLMHHNAVRLPPVPTALEQIYSVALFQILGVPMENLQICAAGHWPEEVVRVVAGTYLLGTGQSPTYKPGAFGTKDDERTGFRLMVRGKGVLDRTVPFSLPGIPHGEDRTDKLGSVDPQDFTLGHIMGTLVPHALYGGRYAEIGRRWLDRSTKLFEGTGVAHALGETTWIKQHAPKSRIDTPEHHESVVSGMTELWKREVVRPDQGLVGEVQRLLAGASDEALTHREAVISEDRDDFLRMMRW